MSKWVFYFTDGTSTHVECERVVLGGGREVAAGWVAATNVPSPPLPTTPEEADRRDESIRRTPLRVELLVPQDRLLYAKRIS